MSKLFGLTYARPSFIEGIARIFDFANTLSIYNTGLTPAQADYLALKSDWRAVGFDIEKAITQVLAEKQPGVEQEAIVKLVNFLEAHEAQLELRLKLEKDLLRISSNIAQRKTTTTIDEEHIDVTRQTTNPGTTH